MATVKYVKRKQMAKEYKGDDEPNTIRERVAKLLKEGNYTENQVEKIVERKDQILRDVNYEVLELVFYENPVKTHRPYVTRWNTFTPRADEDNKMMEVFHEEKIKEELMTICTPIILDIKAYHPIPSSFNKRDTVLAEVGLITNMATPDWDNIGKAYCDMQNMLTYLDDGLIIDGRVRKLYSTKPRVVARIAYQSHILTRYQHRLITNRKTFKELVEKGMAEEPKYLEEVIKCKMENVED